MSLDNYVDSEKPLNEHVNFGKVTNDIELEIDLLGFENIMRGFRILFFGILIGLVLYGFVWRVASLIHLGSIWTAILAAVLTLLLLFYYEGVTKVNVERIQASIFAGIIFAFLIVTLKDYVKNDSNNVNKSYNQAAIGSSESGILNSVGGVWFTDKIFKKGDKVRIEVLYNKVKMTNGAILSPGVYDNMSINGNGQLTFLGLMNKIAQVKVSY